MHHAAIRPRLRCNTTLWCHADARGDSANLATLPSSSQWRILTRKKKSWAALGLVGSVHKKQWITFRRPPAPFNRLLEVHILATKCTLPQRLSIGVNFSVVNYGTMRFYFQSRKKKGFWALFARRFSQSHPDASRAQARSFAVCHTDETLVSLLFPSYGICFEPLVTHGRQKFALSSVSCCTRGGVIFIAVFVAPNMPKRR